MRHTVYLLILLTFVSTGLLTRGAQATSPGYVLAWPGILPDHALYPIKVFRNKLIAKMIYDPVKRIEFDLLMADKTLYASSLLLARGNTQLARETALKGENYFSILVTDYRLALAKKKPIPQALTRKITRAYLTHQRLIADLIASSPRDPETFRQVQYFALTNFQALRDAQKIPKKEQ